MATIDLNCDMGEGFGRWRLGDDDAMLEVVTSANVACGFHAGDPVGILETLAGAARRGVAVGAHPSYRDLAGFGRRYVDASPRELYGDVVYQLGALAGLARAAGTRVSYVKPHGALYNTIAGDVRHAPAVIDAIAAVDVRLPVMALAGSPFVQRARDAGLRVVQEAFADRAYTAAGTLVSRREPGAVLRDEAVVVERMVRLAETGELEAIDGTVLSLEVDSICVHGDTPGAVGMARAVRAALERAGVTVRPFAAVE